MASVSTVDYHEKLNDTIKEIASAENGCTIMMVT